MGGVTSWWILYPAPSHHQLNTIHPSHSAYPFLIHSSHPFSIHSSRPSPIHSSHPFSIHSSRSFSIHSSYNTIHPSHSAYPFPIHSSHPFSIHSSRPSPIHSSQNSLSIHPAPLLSIHPTLSLSIHPAPLSYPFIPPFPNLIIFLDSLFLPSSFFLPPPLLLPSRFYIYWYKWFAIYVICEVEDLCVVCSKDGFQDSCKGIPILAYGTITRHRSNSNRGLCSVKIDCFSVCFCPARVSCWFCYIFVSILP